ncbi:hypothetical protein [Streptantibioticus cattleyicolor]|nr:hypothetical protein [Streptomyces sp. SID5468]CCB73253.1 protein of unknown function [Streptantibioticus cattleyicolor NRRL 8057 = DSM 46488]
MWLLLAADLATIIAFTQWYRHARRRLARAQEAVARQQYRTQTESALRWPTPAAAAAHQIATTLHHTLNNQDNHGHPNQ